MTKCVRWSTITVYEFGVALGGSAIPKHGGPSVGLARKPKCVWKTTVNEADAGQNEWECGREKVKKSKRVHIDRVKAKRGVSVRRRKVRWLKPCERAAMLTRAGLSEKRIFRYLMESSEIAMSRRLSLSVDRRVPV